MTRNYTREGKLQYGWKIPVHVLKKSEKGRQQLQNRAAKNNRNAARSMFDKSKIKGMDIDHKNSNPYDNRKSNLRVRTVNSNRSDNKKHSKKLVKKLKQRTSIPKAFMRQHYPDDPDDS